MLEELWGQSIIHQPDLFYVHVSEIPDSDGDEPARALVADFDSLLGPNRIVVRTSVRINHDKDLNLPRTDCLTPQKAVDWCISKKKEFINQGKDPNSLAFIMHRYIDSRASAWVRADPSDPTVEIHSLWGLPDALQYCPYDIWEVHVPTGSATEYPDYKSHILIARDDGAWKYERVKNEVARSLSISRRDALYIARESRSIAGRIGKACHIMWFVGCLDSSGEPFNIPWYWVPAHYANPNEDRTRHVSFRVTGRASLELLRRSEIDNTRYVIVLHPDQPSLFRDNGFLNEVAEVARVRDIPVVLEGSTLAHAYYQLVDRGCVVIARGEKEHSRIRKSTPFGKIVRDKVPDRIATKQELGASVDIPESTREAFLIGKIIEEALEVRDSPSRNERTIEIADLLEIVRALAQIDGVSLPEVISAADKKREQLGGFEHRQLLLQTGIGAPGQKNIAANPPSAQVLSHSTGPDVGEVPFTFFGFAELDTPRTIPFTAFGISLELTLKSDRLVLRILREPEQLELPLSLEIDGDPTKPS